MTIERTLTIIKPDAVAKGASGAILARLTEEGFRVVGLRQRYLSLAQAQGFYHVHAARPFFAELTEFMSSGPCVTAVLEREGAITRLRDVMGATDPAKAAPGTLRAQFATDIGRNAIHGSDSPASAAEEIAYFFAGIEIPRGESRA